MWWSLVILTGIIFSVQSTDKDIGSGSSKDERKELRKKYNFFKKLSSFFCCAGDWYLEESIPSGEDYVK